MSSYGATTIHTGGRGVAVSKDGRPDWKVGGITVDWSTVTAVAADTTMPAAKGALVIKSGDKYLAAGKVLCKITSSGKYGPYDAAAADGRQELVPGNCWILNETVLLSDPGSDHPAVFDGGRVYEERITDIADISTHQVANPDASDLRAAFPRIGWGTD